MKTCCKGSEKIGVGACAHSDDFCSLVECEVLDDHSSFLSEDGHVPNKEALLHFEAQ